MIKKPALAAALASVFIPHTFAATSTNLAGTTSRQEMEFKLAFTGLHNINRKKLANDIQKLLVKTIKRADWNFPNQQRYGISKEPMDFAFRDLYFDTPNLDLANSEISYRLRHRWKGYEDFFLHERFPNKHSYFPIRCEIQLKTDYQQAKNGMTIADETRFEFRNESKPFSEGMDAPPPPWPLQEYQQYATSGRYGKYSILPYQKLTKHLLQQKLEALSPSIMLITERIRSHLKLANPWGSGPNPDQIFIVTLDQSRILALGEMLVKNKGSDWKTISAIEFEIEIDRSVMTGVLNGLKSQDKALAVAAKKTKTDLESDLIIIHQAIVKFMKKKFGATPVAVKSKYKRFTELVRKT